MKKTVLAFASIFLLSTLAMSQAQSSQEEQIMYMDFDKISIWGHVYNESQQSLGGIKVEIRLAYDPQQKKPEIMGAADVQSHVWEYLYKTLGTSVFGWAETNEEGLYRINGVPRPGAFFLLVRHAEDYLQTKVPVIIHKTGAKEFEADIYLRARKSAIEPLSKKALKEIIKAKEAVAERDTDKATKHFQKAIEIEPKFAEAHYNLGILLRQEGKIDVAVEHFIKSIEYQANYGLALFSLGETLHAQKKYSQSNLYLGRYLEVTGAEENKTVAEAHYLIGTNYFNLKKAKRAILHLSKAIELEPRIHPNAYIFLANSYVIERDGRNAIKNYIKFTELYPNAPNIQQVKTILEKLESIYPEDKKK